MIRAAGNGSISQYNTITQVENGYFDYLGDVSLPFIMQFSELIITLEGLQQQLSHQAVADLLMTLRNWLIGFYIVEYELFKNFYLTYPNILQFLTEKY